MKNQKEWFEEWFDSPYYPLLYSNRNYSEAELFLSGLINVLELKPTDNIIDLACGRGRHSVFLNKKGFNVTGVDLSVQSIKEAQTFQNKNLHFKVADLRALQLNQKYNIALNLFTSFGYFDCLNTNLLVLKNIHRLLLPNGILVIDFFNLHTTLKGLVQHEEKLISNVKFTINRNLQLGNIVKQILVEHNGYRHIFYEKVQALDLNDFEMCLGNSGFKIMKIYGNYLLESYHKESSSRLIIIAQKC